jgi:hypothetical protein
MDYPLLIWGMNIAVGYWYNTANILNISGFDGALSIGIGGLVTVVL